MLATGGVRHGDNGIVLVLGLVEERLAALEKQRRRVADVGDGQDQEPDEADGGQQPGAVLVVVCGSLVKVDGGNETQAQAKGEEEGSAGDAPLAPGLGASDDGKEGHDDKSETGGNIRVLELH